MEKDQIVITPLSKNPYYINNNPFMKFQNCVLKSSENKGGVGSHQVFFPSKISNKNLFFNNANKMEGNTTNFKK